ncbi:MAG: folate-binding protein [Hyphomicrobiaceae bacterium]|nr:folate-binding protein [Hyphomicrobiaceae bacterium]
MTTCNIAELTDRTAIRVTGDDARKFLQDVVTNDVTKAVDGEAVHAALLSPQGKILFDFFLLDRGEYFLLECARDTRDDLIKRLMFYRLRAAVEFEDPSDDIRIWAAWDGNPGCSEDVIKFADPRVETLGFRMIAPISDEMTQSECDAANEAAYHSHRISLGIPEAGKDYALGETFPHEADYDQLAGVDFQKGCYVGQEVVSRVEHRGTARKRIVPVRGDSDLSAGAQVSVGDSNIGVMGSVSGDRGLAMIRLDRAKKAISQGEKMHAGNIEITLEQPSWASFEVPTPNLPGAAR